MRGGDRKGEPLDGGGFVPEMVRVLASEDISSVGACACEACWGVVRYTCGLPYLLARIVHSAVKGASCLWGPVWE